MNRLRYHLPVVCALALFASSAFSAEDKVYKYRMPDGSIMYSQGSSGGGQLEEVIPVPPPAPPARQRAVERKLERGLEKEEAKAERLAEQRRIREAAENRVERAEQALRRAENALRSGMEPEPGERQGTAGPYSRLNEAYWARIEALRESVDIARERLERERTEYQALR